MPKLKYQDKDFYLRWPKESDWIILEIAHRYGSTRLLNYKNGEHRRIFVVDWKRAEACGELKGLPKCTLLQLSKRYGELKRKYGDENYYKKKNQQNKKYKTTRKNNSFKNKLHIWKNVIPDEVKTQLGYKARQIWSDGQKALLLSIAKDYSHTNVDWKKLFNDPLVKKLPAGYTITKLAHYYQHLQSTNHPTHNWTATQINLLLRLSKKHTKNEIDWPALMKDKRLKQLPEKYANDLHHLRKYYWNVARKDRNSPEYIKKHREDALRWKKENLEQYHQNQQNRRKLINHAVGEFLNAKIGVRK